MPNSWTYNFIEVAGHNLEVSVYNVCIINQFQTTFLKGGGGGNPLVELTVNFKEENSLDFCPNYVQEFSRRNTVVFFDTTFAVQIYTFLWFWFIILAAITGIFLIYRFFVILAPGIRAALIQVKTT